VVVPPSPSLDAFVEPESEPSVWSVESVDVVEAFFVD